MEKDKDKDREEWLAWYRRKIDRASLILKCTCNALFIYSRRHFRVCSALRLLFVRFAASESVHCVLKWSFTCQVCQQRQASRQLHLAHVGALTVPSSQRRASFFAGSAASTRKSSTAISAAPRFLVELETPQSTEAAAKRGDGSTGTVNSAPNRGEGPADSACCASADTGHCVARTYGTLVSGQH